MSHEYTVRVRWTGDRGEGTRTYEAYDRAHEIDVEGKPLLLGSSDGAFRGDESRHNPEDLFVASLSCCHMLWYLSICAKARIVVPSYEDRAQGTMEVAASGGGRFTSVVLRPRVRIAREGKLDTATSLHQKAHQSCFIANSVNFPVECRPEVSF